MGFIDEYTEVSAEDIEKIEQLCCEYIAVKNEIESSKEAIDQMLSNKNLLAGYKCYMEAENFVAARGEGVDDLLIVQKLKSNYPGLSEVISIYKEVKSREDSLKVIEIQILHQILCDHIFLEDEQDITCLHCGLSTKDFKNEGIKSTLLEISNNEGRILKGISIKYKDIVLAVIGEIADDQTSITNMIPVINTQASYKILSKTLVEVLKQKDN